MVDVGEKAPTRRTAVAQGTVVLSPEVRSRLMAGELPKGEALAVARIAGIQAAKETARWIPLCHPLPLSSVQVDFEPLGEDSLRVVAIARCTGPTGVEMEALIAVSAAALTVYDMCKGVMKGIRITGIELLRKEGGRSGTWTRDDAVAP